MKKILIIALLAISYTANAQFGLLAKLGSDDVYYIDQFLRERLNYIPVDKWYSNGTFYFKYEDPKGFYEKIILSKSDDLIAMDIWVNSDLTTDKAVDFFNSTMDFYTEKFDEFKPIKNCWHINSKTLNRINKDNPYIATFIVLIPKLTSSTLIYIFLEFDKRYTLSISEVKYLK